VPAKRKAPKRKPRQSFPTAAPSVVEPPAVRSFEPGANDIKKAVAVDDLRRATRGASWSVREKLDGAGPLPRYPLGGSMEGRGPADPSQRIKWEEVFAVPPKNPHLLSRAVELGLLPRDDLRLLPAVPAAADEQAQERTQRKAKGSRSGKKLRKRKGA
jgi:hypothetical protein